MDLDVSPLAGWRYRKLETHCTVDASLFTGHGDNDNDAAFVPRGCCWNALTKCLLVCDIERCCVRVFSVSSADHSATATTATLPNQPLLQCTPHATMPTIGDRGASVGQFEHPVAVDVSARGEIAVADMKLSRVQVFLGTGALQYYFGHPGTGRGEFKDLRDVKFTPLGHLALADTGNHRVQIMTPTGGLVAVVGCFGVCAGEFDTPMALAVARSGELFVCDAGNRRIQRFSAKGRVLAVWGCVRCRRQRSTSGPLRAAELANDAPTVLHSVFDAPRGIAISGNGDVVVSDAGSHSRVFVFSNTGACRHVLRLPTASPQVIAICYCSASLVAISQSTLLPQSARSTTLTTVTNSSRDVLAYTLTVYPPPERVAVGLFASWPIRCVVLMVQYLTYTDALSVRLANRFLHGVCRSLRNSWQLTPLIPGTATTCKYNRVITPATGLVAVHEAFDRYGLRVYKPLQSVRRHVMDFDSGFCSAISTLHGALFRFQHEAILRVLFAYYAKGRDEIDRNAFVAIATIVAEVRAGLLEWRQCAAFEHVQVPAVYDEHALSTDASASAHVPASLRLVESAQQLQMNKLLHKLRAL